MDNTLLTTLDDDVSAAGGKVGCGKVLLSLVRSSRRVRCGKSNRGGATEQLTDCHVLRRAMAQRAVPHTASCHVPCRALPRAVPCAVLCRVQETKYQLKVCDFGYSIHEVSEKPKVRDVTCCDDALFCVCLLCCGGIGQARCVP